MAAPRTPRRPLPGALLALALALVPACRNLQGVAQPEAVLEGRVVHLERLSLPPGAELAVRLVEPGPSGAPGDRGGPLAELRLHDPGPSPYPFRLPYDPRRVQPGRVLRLEAALLVEGETWFLGARSLSGLAAGPPPEPVELRVHRVPR